MVTSTLVGMTISLAIPLLSLALERAGVDPFTIGVNTAAGGLGIFLVAPFIGRLVAGLGVVGCFRVGARGHRRVHADLPALGRPHVLVLAPAGVRRRRRLDVRAQRGRGERDDARGDPRARAGRLRHPVQPRLRQRALGPGAGRQRGLDAVRPGQRAVRAGHGPAGMLRGVEQPARRRSRVAARTGWPTRGAWRRWRWPACSSTRRWRRPSSRCCRSTRSAAG